MARKPFTTTIDENMQQEFRQTCNERQEKMNDVLEVFMKSYINGEFTIGFSATDILSAPDGEKYETRIFIEDGIYEVTMLSRQPKAKEFRAWVRQVIKSLRKGELVVQETQLSKEQSLDMIKAKTKRAQLLYNMASEFKDVLPASQIEKIIKQVTDILSERTKTIS